MAPGALGLPMSWMAREARTMANYPETVRGHGALRRWANTYDAHGWGRLPPDVAAKFKEAPHHLYTANVWRAAAEGSPICALRLRRVAGPVRPRVCQRQGHGQGQGHGLGDALDQCRMWSQLPRYTPPLTPLATVHLPGRASSSPDAAANARASARGSRTERR